MRKACCNRHLLCIFNFDDVTAASDDLHADHNGVGLQGLDRQDNLSVIFKQHLVAQLAKETGKAVGRFLTAVLFFILVHIIAASGCGTKHKDISDPEHEPQFVTSPAEAGLLLLLILLWPGPCPRWQNLAPASCRGT